ncbi:MAG: flippase-like domain-containing protein [Lachnospiraceae bacterium]|nr:flippase-like domain-containing protein [Lachnospiraceae bacterium]
MNKKTIFWAIFSIIIAVLTVWAVTAQSRSFSFDRLLELLRSSNKIWLLLSFASMLGYIWFEGLSIITVTSSLGYTKSYKRGLLFGASDVYFSAITPSASGGQPACAWFMLQSGVPAATATVALLITLVMYTLALLLSGLTALVFNFSVFLDFSRLSKIMVVVGSAILLILGFFFLLLLIRPKILYNMCIAFNSFIRGIGFVKFSERLDKKLGKLIEDYSLCSKLLLGKGRIIFRIFIWNMLQRISYIMITFFLFKAVGHNLSHSLKALVVQCLASAGSNCVPIPGAMGAADYMLIDGFKQFLSEEAAINMEVLCRGVTFYGSVTTGLIFVVIGYIIIQIRKKK